MQHFAKNIDIALIAMIFIEISDISRPMIRFLLLMPGQEAESNDHHKTVIVTEYFISSKNAVNLIRFNLLPSALYASSNQLD